MPTPAAFGDRELNWRTSSRCNSTPHCVEVAFSAGQSVIVRSTINPIGPCLGFSFGSWNRLVTALKGRPVAD